MTAGRVVTLYDTTLRDGAQTEGISFSVTDKLKIAERLAALGIHQIEGGWPGSNPKDEEFFRVLRIERWAKGRVVAFGSTRRPATAAGRDPNLRALLAAETETVTIFGKSWHLHVRDVLRVALDENLRMIESSVALLRKRGRAVIYDAEHFFDGYAGSPDYALKTLEVARAAGCSTLVLCDTNGGTITSELVRVVQQVKGIFGGSVGIHAHNDCDMAVANSIAAVEAGCDHVQGTVNGFGERCGNANLCSIIGNLKLKLGVDCITDLQLRTLTQTASYVSEMSNMVMRPYQPFVGASAFAHKGGVHVNAVLKNARTYEHVEPERVGNQRRVLVSELAGRSGLHLKAADLRVGVDLKGAAGRIALAQVKALEHLGYQFEAAGGSLALVVQKALKTYKPFFELRGFRVIVEKRTDERVISEATIELSVDGRPEHTAALGEGPVSALDNALRKALEQFYPAIKQMHLSDFKVRVLDETAGTAARVRVLIQSQDAKGTWGTVGVSENIIEASWQALVDSIEYKLLRDQRGTG